MSSKRSMRRLCSSGASSRLSVASARSPSAVLKTRQMVCSDEACEIMMMLMPSRARAAKMRAAKTGDAHHAAALDVDQGDPLDRGDTR